MYTTVLTVSLYNTVEYSTVQYNKSEYSVFQGSGRRSPGDGDQAAVQGEQGGPAAQVLYCIVL